METRSTYHEIHGNICYNSSRGAGLEWKQSDFQMWLRSRVTYLSPTFAGKHSIHFTFFKEEQSRFLNN